MQKKINVNIANTNITNSLKKISEISEVNFTFNPSILPNKLINKSYVNQTLKSILSEILSEHDINFVELSGQIILYRKDEILNFNSGLVPKNKIDTVITKKFSVKTNQVVQDAISTNTKIKTDTVFVNNYDTIYIIKYDTIVLINTIVKVDTFFLADTTTIFDKIYAKPSRLLSKPWISADIAVSYQPNISNSTSVNKTQLFSNDLEERLFVTSVRGYSIMGKINFQFSRFSLQTGLGFNKLIQDFKHIDKTTGGHFVKDTIERYYTSIQNQDTNWLYVTKDKWIETSEIYKNNSSVNNNYIQIPLQIAYSVRIKKLAFEISTGIFTEFPLKKEIKLYFDTTNFSQSKNDAVNNLKFKTKSPNFSFQISLSVNYLINNNMCLVVQPYYYSNLGTIYSIDSQISQTFNYASIYFGLRYYFNSNRNRVDSKKNTVYK